MQIHQLNAKKLNKSKKRIGRGGKRGTYSGHGGKGQTARAGANFRPIVRDILKRYPKLRGYKNRPTKAKPKIINIEILEAKFKEGEFITPQVLVEKKLVRRVGAKLPRIKILGNAAVSKKLNIVGCDVSESSKKIIKKAGGTIKI